MHLASLNIARAKHPAGAPEMADFENHLVRINMLATKSEGYVWHYESVGDGVALTHPAFDDPQMLLNLVVFESIETLHHFAFMTAHKKIMNRNLEVFEPPRESYHAMWWVEEGDIPTMEEAKTRLDALRAIGPSAESFSWDQPFDEIGKPLEPFQSHRAVEPITN